MKAAKIISIMANGIWQRKQYENENENKAASIMKK